MGKTQLTQAVQTFFGVRKQLLIGSPVMGPECTDDAVEGYARWAGLDGQPYAGGDWTEAVANSIVDIEQYRTVFAVSGADTGRNCPPRIDVCLHAAPSGNMLDATWADQSETARTAECPLNLQDWPSWSFRQLGLGALKCNAEL